jgi:enamine deaminase RidA (YjgF/YER057c/UK114 family)
MNTLCAVVSLLAGLQDGGLEYLEPDPGSGTSAAVVVRGSALAYTAQVLPVDPRGEVVGDGDPERQIATVLEGLSAALREVGADLDRAVRIHVYAARTDVLEKTRAVLARRFAGPAKPAATFVVTVLPHPKAVVAMDAVAAAAPGPAARRGRSAAVLPRGEIVFISGQTAPGELLPAARTTIEGLRATLDELGLTSSRVVQAKVFMRPIGEAAAIRSLFKDLWGADLPPLVFVEWTLGNPIEIELTAAGDAAPGAGADRLRFVSARGMKESPVFSHVVRANSETLIYTSGLTGQGDAEAQVRSIFRSLHGLLATPSSDFRHLAKATYYVTDEGTAAKLAEVRKELYNPARPPAASKAYVAGVGAEGKAVTIDMIAVTRH